ncbi:unnamed protein product [Hapterophycus canaliculatus]
MKANAAMSPGMETSLFGCFSDPLGCVMSCCCGCIVSGFSAARVDDRECTPCDIFTNDYAPLPDFISMYCCGFCFIMQTAKEVALKRGDEPVYFGEVGMNLMGDR